MNDKKGRGNISNWCRNPLRYDEMMDFENLWLRHRAEFLPSKSLRFERERERKRERGRDREKGREREGEGEERGGGAGEKE